MDVTKPYKFIRFGAMDVTKPYKFIGFGAMDARTGQSRADAAVLQAAGQARPRRGPPEQVVEVELRVGREDRGAARVHRLQEVLLATELQDLQHLGVFKAYWQLSLWENDHFSFSFLLFWVSFWPKLVPGPL